MKKIVIGIDQSYKNTGVSIAVDGKIKNITSIWLESAQDNSERRNIIKQRLNSLFDKMSKKANKNESELLVIIERIRLSSQGFINIDYIKSIGALNACIVDTAKKYGIKVCSVDTRSWKSQVVGTSKPKNNNVGVDPEKWPTIEWAIKNGFEDSIIREVSARKKKGVFIRDGKRYVYNDDAADSAGIALYGFVDKKSQKLEEEH